MTTPNLTLVPESSCYYITAGNRINGPKPGLTNVVEDIETGLYGDTTGLSGNATDLTGDATGSEGNINDMDGDISWIKGNLQSLSGTMHENLSGDVTLITGDLTGVWGNADFICGDLDTCGLVQADRDAGVDIATLVA